MSFNLSVFLRALNRFVFEENRKKIIIAGCGRTGTSLLSAIIGAHPNVTAIDFETYAFVEIFSKNYRYNFFKKKYELLRLEYLKTRLENNVTSNLLCEKTPRNLYYINEIRELYEGNVKFLLMIRNGRDVLTSKHPGQSEYYISMSRWISDTSLTLDICEDDTNNDVMLVSYEGLINKLELSVKQITDFLEIPYDKSMLEFSKHSTVKKHGAFHDGQVKDIYKTSSMRWKDTDHNERIAEINNSKEVQKLLKRVDNKTTSLLKDLDSIKL
ncbi:sulfotransferase family protein [Salibacter halophilus]|uniref:Sulfotransferase n=1 Tax=Salibacter halophilus TaxID=1803916 RepID=A0A6N6M8V7_9FLAO|nr:sulfotransferase [Salibacter halophilus]KAB1063537.1 sulfotransferase [Salibacter halophilus]